MVDLNGQVVLVTGAGRGIGRALAKAFAGAGARVACNDLTPINLDATVDAILAAGGEALGFSADVSRPLAAGAMVQELLDAWRRIDVLVNNAAVAPQADLISMDEWDWLRVLEVNLSGAAYMMQAAGREMQAQGGGAILNIAANLDWAARLQRRAAYQASQWAIVGLTRAAANEFQAYNMRVNALCLAGVAAPDGAGTGDAPHAWDEFNDLPTLTLAEVSRRALALCAPDSPLTGQVINLP